MANLIITIGKLAEENRYMTTGADKMSVELQASDEGWKVWTFNQALQIDQSEPTETKDFSRNRNIITEEGLETLLLLNLDTVFPDWQLRLVGNLDANFRATDIEAADPAGVQHIFELKYKSGAGTDKIVSQTLSYALNRIGYRNEDWFDEKPQHVQRLQLASRMAAFWLNIRSATDSESTFSKLPVKEAFENKLDNLARRLANAGEVDIPKQAFIDAADEWLKARDEQLNAGNHWPQELADVHLHLVMPNATRIDAEERIVLKRLQEENLRVDIWEAQVNLEKASGTGKLAIREMRFPDTPKRHFHVLRGRRTTELLSEMAHQNLLLHKATPSWDSYGDENSRTLRVFLPLANEDCNGPSFKITATDDELRFRTELGVPGHLKDKHSLTELKTEVMPTAMRAVRNWIAEIFPPDEDKYPDDARRLENFNHSTKNWEGTYTFPADGPTVKARAKHTGSLRRSELTLILSDEASDVPLETIATLANELFDKFVRQLIAQGARPVGWTAPNAT